MGWGQDAVLGGITRECPSEEEVTSKLRPERNVEDTHALCAGSLR